MTTDSKRAAKAIAAQERAAKQRDRLAKIAERMEKKVYTVEEIAVALNLDPATISRLVKSGEIPSIKIGGSRRITAAWLEKRLAGDAP